MTIKKFKYGEITLKSDEIVCQAIKSRIKFKWIFGKRMPLSGFKGK